MHQQTEYHEAVVINSALEQNPLFLSLCLATVVYIPADKGLYDTIVQQDSLLFTAFNSRNLLRIDRVFSANLEVFQDNTGVRNHAQTIDAFKRCFNKDYALTRTLVKGILEVYLLKDYGAIETGRHTFCHTENGKLDCATFKFVHIWKKKMGDGKLRK